MPRRDGTGPDGNEAGTGRGMGPCNGNKDAGRPVLGKRRRRRCGRACRWDESNKLISTEN